jgi:hypothetical protein
MTSTIDALLALRDRCCWVERLASARFAQAGNLSWERGPGERERDFLDRVRAEAAGHHTVDVRGVIMLPVVTTMMAAPSADDLRGCDIVAEISLSASHALVLADPGGHPTSPQLREERNNG